MDKCVDFEVMHYLESRSNLQEDFNRLSDGIALIAGL